MAQLAIQATNISKRYQIGVLNSGSLKQDIHTFWRRSFGFSKGDKEAAEKAIDRKHIWALKDINFEIRQGEVLGLVGRNGAGKSTLLKVISRVTLPTSGSIRGNGRISSLLEVGTGFHPELTGRENIFLNGQILGMKKKEVVNKFDEIVAFSAVEKFIDTPVKRYSSGMYLRLSFAVAAHLDSDILIVDEALAVGDAEFQAKCMAKMKEVSSQEGKTVLFVSHNMQAMRTLCKRAICIEAGTIIDDNTADRVIANYLNRDNTQYLIQEFEQPSVAPGNKFIKIKKTEIVVPFGEGKLIDTTTPVNVVFEFWQYTDPGTELVAGIHLYHVSGTCIFDLHSDCHTFSHGLVRGECTIPGNLLNNGSYYLSIDFITKKKERLYSFDTCLSFDVINYKKITGNHENWNGYLQLPYPVSLKLLSHQ